MPLLVKKGQYSHKGFIMINNRAQKKGESLTLMLIGIFCLLFAQSIVSKPQKKAPLRVLNQPRSLPVKRKTPVKKNNLVQRTAGQVNDVLMFKKSSLAKEALEAMSSCAPVNHKNIKKFKEIIAQHEYVCLTAIAEKYHVPQSVWNGLYARMTKLRSMMQKTIFKQPLPCVYRNPNLPKTLVDLIESIAIKYGIHPKAFHIQIPEEKSPDMEDPSLYDAWIDAPVVFYQFSGEKLSAGLRIPPVLFIPQSFINRFVIDRESCLLTLHHELIHLRELNGWTIGFILNLFAQKGYCAPKKGNDGSCAYYKIMERNTDLLALIDDPELSRTVLMQEYAFLDKILPEDMHRATFDHFPFALMLKWHFLVSIVQKGKDFEKIKSFMAALCKEEEKLI